MAEPVTPPAAPTGGETPTATPTPVAPQRPGQGVVVMPGEDPEKEKHTVPPELPNVRYHMARGGWRRISMHTVQSDDKRFTITHVDPTRRSDWFLLKDLETGESHEFTTITEAKKKAKELRGDADDDFDVEDDEIDSDVPVHEDETSADEYGDHEYCSKCGECTTCNLRPCSDGGEHTSGKTAASEEDDQRLRNAIGSDEELQKLIASTTQELEQLEQYSQTPHPGFFITWAPISGPLKMDFNGRVPWKNTTVYDATLYSSFEEAQKVADQLWDWVEKNPPGPPCAVNKVDDVIAHVIKEKKREIGIFTRLNTTKSPNRTAKLAAEDTMARPIQEKWARMRQVAAEEPKEADAALAEVADALGTMADALSNLRSNLDLIEAPKTASIKTRIESARKYASMFRRMAEENPEIVADAISEVYHSLDDVAGALENLAENMGIELSMTPAEEAVTEEGKEELEGDIPAEELEAPKVDEEAFEEGKEELESPEGEAAEDKIDEEVKEASGSDWFATDRDEEGKPKSPVIAAKTEECGICGPGHGKPGTKCERHGKLIPKGKKADGSAPFVSDRDENAKPEAPGKLDIPEAQGESEVNKAAAARLAMRQRIAKRWGVEVG